MSYVVTGTSSSRLVELKKFKDTNDFMDKYYSNGSLTNNGVDYNNSIENEVIVYYISGVKYIDYPQNNLTFFSFEGVEPDNNPDFIDAPIIKNPNKSNVVSQPKISSDVFIDRQQQSIFDKNYRLEFIGNLGELATYVSGKFYNIKKNS